MDRSNIFDVEIPHISVRLIIGGILSVVLLLGLRYLSASELGFLPPLSLSNIILSFIVVGLVLMPLIFTIKIQENL